MNESRGIPDETDYLPWSKHQPEFFGSGELKIKGVGPSFLCLSSSFHGAGFEGSPDRGHRS